MYRINGRGTYVIRRRYKGVGEIRRASGTNDKQTFKAILTMLKQFEQTGRHTILREVRDGIVTPIEVYSAFLEERLDTLPSAATLKPLYPTVQKWVGSYEAAESTRRRYEELLSSFQKHVPEGSTLESIPSLLSKYRKVCKEKGTAVTFNRTRTVFQAFLRDTLGNDSPLWREVSQTKPLKVTPKTKRPPVSPGRLTVVLKKLSDINPEHAVLAYFLAVTGMNWKECADATWVVENDRVRVEGTKKESRKRVVPLVDSTLIPDKDSLPNYNAFRMALKKASKNELTPHSLRRCYAHYLELAGVPRSRRKVYLGHRTGDVTSLYEAHEVDTYLKQDAELIREFLKNWFDEQFEAIVEEQLHEETILKF